MSDPSDLEAIFEITDDGLCDLRIHFRHECKPDYFNSDLQISLSPQQTPWLFTVSTAPKDDEDVSFMLHVNAPVLVSNFSIGTGWSSNFTNFKLNSYIGSENEMVQLNVAITKDSENPSIFECMIDLENPWTDVILMNLKNQIEESEVKSLFYFESSIPSINSFEVSSTLISEENNLSWNVELAHPKFEGELLIELIDKDNSRETNIKLASSTSSCSLYNKIDINNDVFYTLTVLNGENMFGHEIEGEMEMKYETDSYNTKMWLSVDSIDQFKLDHVTSIQGEYDWSNTMVFNLPFITEDEITLEFEMAKKVDQIDYEFSSEFKSPWTSSVKLNSHLYKEDDFHFISVVEYDYIKFFETNFIFDQHFEKSDLSVSFGDLDFSWNHELPKKYFAFSALYDDSHYLKASSDTANKDDGDFKNFNFAFESRYSTASLDLSVDISAGDREINEAPSFNINFMYNDVYDGVDAKLYGLLGNLDENDYKFGIDILTKYSSMESLNGKFDLSFTDESEDITFDFDFTASVKTYGQLYKASVSGNYDPTAEDKAPLFGFDLMMIHGENNIFCKADIKRQSSNIRIGTSSENDTYMFLMLQYEIKEKVTQRETKYEGKFAFQSELFLPDTFEGHIKYSKKKSHVISIKFKLDVQSFTANLRLIPGRRGVMKFGGTIINELFYPFNGRVGGNAMLTDNSFESSFKIKIDNIKDYVEASLKISENESKINIKTKHPRFPKLQFGYAVDFEEDYKFDSFLKMGYFDIEFNFDIPELVFPSGKVKGSLSLNYGETPVKYELASNYDFIDDFVFNLLVNKDDEHLFIAEIALDLESEDIKAKIDSPNLNVDLDIGSTYLFRVYDPNTENDYFRFSFDTDEDSLNGFLYMKTHDPFTYEEVNIETKLTIGNDSSSLEFMGNIPTYYSYYGPYKHEINGNLQFDYIGAVEILLEEMLSEKMLNKLSFKFDHQNYDDDYFVYNINGNIMTSDYFHHYDINSINNKNILSVSGSSDIDELKFKLHSNMQAYDYDKIDVTVQFDYDENAFFEKFVFRIASENHEEDYINIDVGVEDSRLKLILGANTNDLILNYYHFNFNGDLMLNEQHISGSWNNGQVGYGPTFKMDYQIDNSFAKDSGNVQMQVDIAFNNHEEIVFKLSGSYNVRRDVNFDFSTSVSTSKERDGDVFQLKFQGVRKKNAFSFFSTSTLHNYPMVDVNIDYRAQRKKKPAQIVFRAFNKDRQSDFLKIHGSIEGAKVTLNMDHDVYIFYHKVAGDIVIKYKRGEVMINSISNIDGPYYTKNINSDFTLNFMKEYSLKANCDIEGENIFSMSFKLNNENINGEVKIPDLHVMTSITSTLTHNYDGSFEFYLTVDNDPPVKDYKKMFSAVLKNNVEAPEVYDFDLDIKADNTSIATTSVFYDYKGRLPVIKILFETPFNNFEKAEFEFDVNIQNEEAKIILDIFSYGFDFQCDIDYDMFIEFKFMFPALLEDEIGFNFKSDFSVYNLETFIYMGENRLGFNGTFDIYFSDSLNLSCNLDLSLFELGEYIIGVSAPDIDSLSESFKIYVERSHSLCDFKTLFDIMFNSPNSVQYIVLEFNLMEAKNPIEFMVNVSPDDNWMLGTYEFSSNFQGYENTTGEWIIEMESSHYKADIHLKNQKQEIIGEATLSLNYQLNENYEPWNSLKLGTTLKIPFKKEMQFTFEYDISEPYVKLAYVYDNLIYQVDFMTENNEEGSKFSLSGNLPFNYISSINANLKFSHQAPYYFNSAVEIEDRLFLLNSTFEENWILGKADLNYIYIISRNLLVDLNMISWKIMLSRLNLKMALILMTSLPQEALIEIWVSS